MNSIIINMSSPFVCCPIYCKVTGNLLSGALLSCITNLYLHQSTEDYTKGFVFDYDEITANLGVKISTLLDAIQVLKDKKLIKVEKETFIFLGFDALKRILDEKL